MKIQCPNCSYTRDMADDRIPAGVLTARCPQCGQSFRFSRDEAIHADADQHTSDRPSAVRLASLSDKEAAAPADQRSSADGSAGQAGRYQDVPKGAVVHKQMEDLFARPRSKSEDDGRSDAGRFDAGTSDTQAQAYARTERAAAGKPDTSDSFSRQRTERSQGRGTEDSSASVNEPVQEPWQGAVKEPGQGAAKASAHEAEEHTEAEEGWSFNPWECARSLQEFVPALYQTCLRVMFAPQRFFAGIVPRSALLALCFFLAISALQTVIEHVWSLAFFNMLLTDTTDPELKQLGELLSGRGNFLFWLVLRCVMLCLQLYIYTAILYLCWRFVARDHADFSVILQVLCYAQAPLILSIIPGIGTIVGMIWSFVCTLIGCRTALRLTWTQTALGAAPLCLLIIFSYMQFMSVLA